VSLTFSQQKSEDNTLVVNQNFGVVFDKLIDYCIDTNHLVLSIDKDAGFIQSRVYVKNKRIITIKDGDRITYTFVLRPTAENSTLIRLQIYQEEKLGRHSATDNSYYYKDLGVSEDVAWYAQMLENLNEYFAR
jgi:hypothetical protein